MNKVKVTQSDMVFFTKHKNVNIIISVLRPGIPVPEFPDSRPLFGSGIPDREMGSFPTGTGMEESYFL